MIHATQIVPRYMSEQSLADLQRWEVGEPIPEESYAAMTAHPRFAAAIRKLASQFLLLSDRDKALDGMFKDAGRYVAAMCAAYLDASGGITLPRLKELCIRSGYMSPGRARALLLYLVYLRYVELLPVRSGGVSQYRLTSRFLTAWELHFRAALAAARIIEPAVDVVLENIGHPAVLAAFSRFHCEDLLESAKVWDIQSPYLRIFFGRHAGTQIVWLLLCQESESFPPNEPLQFSIASAAGRFSVSRTHIRRLLEEGERENLLRRNPDGTISLLEEARTSIVFVYSTQMIRLLMAAAKTIRRLPELLPLQMGGDAMPASGLEHPAVYDFPDHAGL
jgi:hypothetical protein